MWIILIVIVVVVINSVAASRRRKIVRRQFDVKICGHCGTTQPPHAGYCRQCGQRVEG